MKFQCSKIVCTCVVLTVASVIAEDLCNRLVATGIGDTAPKYRKTWAQGLCQDGEYLMTASGHDFYWGWDRGGFAHVVIGGRDDFTFSATISQSADATVRAPKVGINVREGLIGNDRAIQLRWDGFFMGNTDNAQVSWFYRFLPGSFSTEFCSADDRTSCFREGGTGIRTAEGTRLTIARKNSKYELYVNDERVAEEEILVMGSDSVYVGLIGAFGGSESPLSQMVKFKTVECTGACGGGSAALANSIAEPRKWNAILSNGRLRLKGPGTDEAVQVRLQGIDGRQIQSWNLNGASPLVDLVPGKDLQTGVYWVSLWKQGVRSWSCSLVLSR